MVQFHHQYQKKTRPIADSFAAIATTAPWEPLDYATKFGLVVHSERIAKRRAYYSLQAFASALSGSLDKSWFDAMARSPEEAEINYEMDQWRRQTTSQFNQIAGRR